MSVPASPSVRALRSLVMLLLLLLLLLAMPFPQAQGLTFKRVCPHMCAVHAFMRSAHACGLELVSTTHEGMKVP